MAPIGKIHLLAVLASLVLVLAFGSGANIAQSQPKQYKCTIINEAGFCFIENVILDIPAVGGAELKVKFPKHPTLLIKSGSIPYFGKEIFALLGDTRQLHLYNNTCMKRLVIPVTNLTEINVQRNGLTEFDVEAVENRELKLLSIVHNNIATIPRNIRFLVGLEKLYLYNNSLEYFDLELLANATSLKILSIYDNRIKTVDSRLNLQFPKLQTFSLSKNKLTFVPYFEQSFPALTVVSLRKNQWNCHWLQGITAYVRRRGINVVRKDSTCRDRLIDEICCSHTVTDFLMEWHVVALNRERELVHNLSSENRWLVDAVRKLSDDVLKLQLQLGDAKDVGGGSTVAKHKDSVSADNKSGLGK